MAPLAVDVTTLLVDCTYCVRACVHAKSTRFIVLISSTPTPGRYATIGGGTSNFAAGNLSVVIGSYGKALHESSAVLAFNVSADTPCTSQGDGTISICASGGLYVNGIHFPNTTTTLEHATASNEAAASRHEVAIDSLNHTVTKQLAVIYNLTEAMDSVLRSNVSGLWHDIQDLNDAVDSVNSAVTTNEGDIRNLDSAIAVSRLNVTSNWLSINALEASVAANHEVIADLVRNDSLLLSAVSDVNDRLELLRGNHTENLTIGQLFDDFSALSTTLQIHHRALNDLELANAQHENNTAALRLEDIALWANASAQQQLLTDQRDLLLAVNASANHETTLLWSAVDDVHSISSANVDTIGALAVDDAALWINASAQQRILDKHFDMVELVNASAAEEIARLNDITSEQQVEIEHLRDTVGSLNASLTLLASTVAQLTHATTFAATTVAATADDYTTVDPCAGGDTAMCGTAIGTTEAATSSMDDAASPSVTLHACHVYPCGEAVQVFAWNTAVTLAAEVDSTAAIAALEYVFQLSLNSATLWESTNSNNRFASFVASDLSLHAPESGSYTLSVLVKFSNGSAAQATIEDVLFAAPPLVHGVEAMWTNASAALNWFDVVVNTTDASELSFEYWVIDIVDGWKYLAVVGYGAGAATIGAAYTRDFLLEVVVTNEFGSSAACTGCAILSGPQPQASMYAVVNDSLPTSSQLGSHTLLASIDAVVAVGDTEALGDLFDHFLALVQTNSTIMSQDVVVLHEFLDAGVVDGVLAALNALATRVDSVTEPTLELYLGVTDAYGVLITTASVENALDNVAELDKQLRDTCVALETDTAPDGQVATFEEQSYVFSCASTETTASVQAGGATVVMVSSDGVATVSVSEWNGTSDALSGNNATSLLAGIHGVHVDGAEFDGDAVDVDGDGAISLQIEVHADTGDTLLRKALACSFYDENRTVWSSRGVVLRGIAFDAVVASAICASSHFTLFSLEDTSEATAVVERKLVSLANRVADLNTVDLLAGRDTVNWGVLGVFVGVTAVFLVMITIAKVCGRKEAVAHGRTVFQELGQLSKPNTMGSREYEAVLRRWVAGLDVLKLMAMEVLTSNSVLGLLFHWDHEAVVFGRADKAAIFFGAVLMTFVSSAFLFNPEESTSTDPLVMAWSALVSAMFANVLLLPVQHFLPYMVSNVNSVSTFSRVPLALLSRELKRLSCWKPRKRSRSAAETQARVVLQWMDVAFRRQGATDSKDVAAASGNNGHSTVSTQLNFVTCRVKLPSAAGNAHTATNKAALVSTASSAAAVRAVVQLQRVLRIRARQRREVRSVEFDAWYHGQHHLRHVLAGLTIAVLLVLAAFTLAICLLLSGTFSEDESLLWVSDVAQSLVVQVFVTDPAVTLLVILVKLFVSWGVLRVGTKRQKKVLQRQEEAAESRAVAVGVKVDIVTAKLNALKVVQTGNAQLVRKERAVKQAAQSDCNAALQEISTAKAGIHAERDDVARPRKFQLEKWDSQEAVLHRQQSSLLSQLQCINTALDVLTKDHVDVAAEVHDTEERLEQLRGTLERINDTRNVIRRKQSKLDSDLRAATAIKRNAIVPVRAETLGEEPGVHRALMPTINRAARSKKNSAAAVVPSRGISTQSRSLPRRQRRRSRSKKQPPEAVAGPRTHVAAVNRSAQLSWSEMRALQLRLRKKTAEQVAAYARGRGKKRRVKMSAKLVKLVLKRRERNGRRARQLAASQGPRATTTTPTATTSADTEFEV